MRKITDDDLTLLYYGEHDDPALAALVAESDELSARFDALSRELSLADSYQPPERGDDYGAEVWRRIAPQLAGEPEKSANRLRSWFSKLAQPRFSLAGALSLALVAFLAFNLGRNGEPETGYQPPNISEPVALAQAGIDPGRLLTHSVSTHLEQVNLVLTQFANSTQTSATEAEFATDMLVANRLYRRSADARGEHKLAAFLAELEPLLIELAYQAQSGTATSRERMQREVQDDLLFRVRLMNAQLNKPQISL